MHYIRLPKLSCVVLSAYLIFLSGMAVAATTTTVHDANNQAIKKLEKLPLNQALEQLGKKTGYKLRLSTTKEWESLPVKILPPETKFDVHSGIKKLLDGLDYVTISEGRKQIAIYVYRVSGNKEDIPVLTRRQVKEIYKDTYGKKIPHFERVPPDEEGTTLSNQEIDPDSEVSYDSSQFEVVPPDASGARGVTANELKGVNDKEKAPRYEKFDRVPPVGFGDDMSLN